MLALTLPDQRILQGVSSTLSYQFLDPDGSPAAPAGTVTVRVQKADGSDLVAAGTATTGSGSAPRQLALGPVNTLELLTVTWTDAGDASFYTQYVEVVGGFLFSVAQARGAEKTLADVNVYPTADIVAFRLEVEGEAEAICGRAFVPRFRRATCDGSGRRVLKLPDSEIRTLRTIKVGGVAYSAPELAAVLFDADGCLRLTATNDYWPAGIGNVVVEYEHGWNRPPQELARAAMLRLRNRLNSPRSPVPDRAERFVGGTVGGESVTFLLAMPDEFKTGIPEVDAVYARHSRRSRFRP